MITYLKRAQKTPETETNTAQTVVSDMLANIEKNGEQAVREYALKLDQWSGDILLTPAMIDARTKNISAGIKSDIEFAAAQVVSD